MTANEEIDEVAERLEKSQELEIESPIIKKKLDINREYYNWVKEHYPEGSFTGIVNMLLAKFIETHRYTPAQYAELAAQELKEDLKSL